ncbi:MAG: porphobilinogen synthase [Vicingaceae bacterium]
MIDRPRRLRANETIRSLVRETSLSLNDIIYPIFIEEGENIKKEIPSMPGIYRFSLDKVDEELLELKKLGINSILLFGIPKHKDEEGAETWNDNGIIQQSLRHIKSNYDNFFITTDVCFCEYTNHGHCGVLNHHTVDNDKTLENTQKQVISHAKNGADMIAPSGMMDGVVGSIREALDETGFDTIPIMSYAAKYASAYYGPFRDAADSTPKFGDRKTYQMDPANRREALKEVQLDIEQGADIVMVKPALSYLDIISDIKSSFDVPVAAYNVSGEYSMIKAASEKGWINGQEVMFESLLSMKRAGANIIITYFAKELAKIL